MGYLIGIGGTIRHTPDLDGDYKRATDATDAGAYWQTEMEACHSPREEGLLKPQNLAYESLMLLEHCFTSNGGSLRFPLPSDESMILSSCTDISNDDLRCSIDGIASLRVSPLVAQLVDVIFDFVGKDKRAAFDKVERFEIDASGGVFDWVEGNGYRLLFTRGTDLQRPNRSFLMAKVRRSMK